MNIDSRIECPTRQMPAGQLWKCKNKKCSHFKTYGCLAEFVSMYGGGMVCRDCDTGRAKKAQRRLARSLGPRNVRTAWEVAGFHLTSYRSIGVTRGRNDPTFYVRNQHFQPVERRPSGLRSLVDAISRSVSVVPVSEWLTDSNPVSPTYWSCGASGCGRGKSLALSPLQITIRTDPSSSTPITTGATVISFLRTALAAHKKRSHAQVVPARVHAAVWLHATATHFASDACSDHGSSPGSGPTHRFTISLVEWQA